MTHHSRIVSLLAVALAACGGSSSSSSPAAAAAGATQGAITAKSTGSLTVNGAAIAIGASTSIRIEKQQGTEAELHRGMVVRVKGEIHDRSGTATEVQFEDHLKGRVRSTSSTPTSATIDLGGRTVHLEDSTHLFDDSGNDLTFADIHPDDRLRVSGFADDGGRLRAASVQRLASASADDSFEMKGFVSGLASAAGTTTFTLSPALPAGAEAFAITVPTAGVAAGVKNGSLVEVHAAVAAVGTAVAATSVTLEDGALGPEGAEVEIEGIVTSGTSDAFAIAGQAVVATSSTRWEFGVPADFAVGVKVEVDGHLDATGTLVAEKVSFRANVRIQATVSSVSADSLVALGLPVAFGELTRIEDPPADGQTFEIRGLVRRDALGAVVGVTATRIRARNSGGGGGSFLQGPVDQVTGTSSLTILGISVSTASASFLAHKPSDAAVDVPMTREAFFAALSVGSSVVKAKLAGPPASGTAVASELELEDEPPLHP